LLAAQLPFEADTAIAMVQKQISEAPTPVATFRPDLPDWCSALIDRALEKDPANRFQTAEEFRSALLKEAQPQTLSELPTLATPTPPGLPRDPDMTMAHDEAMSRGMSSARSRLTSASAAVATPPSHATTTYAAAPAAASRSAAAPAPVERTTVVLGRTHLLAIGALFVVLAAGISILAFAALRRDTFQQQLPLLGTEPQLSTATNPPTPPPSEGQPSGTPPGSPASPAAATRAGVVATAGGGSAQPTGSVPAAPNPGRSSAQPAAGAVDAAAAKNAALPPATVSDRAAAPVPPVKTGGAVATFPRIRILVPDTGDKTREREGVLQLGDGRITVVDPDGGGAIVTVPYSSIGAAVYSRSKQPRWRDAEGREVESKVDLGRMSFFRGERNWLILLTTSEPLIIRLEDSELKTVLPAVQEQTGLVIKR
jgi:hypothetical protein